MSRAIDFEIARQAELYDKGQADEIVQETRLWEEGAQVLWHFTFIGVVWICILDIQYHIVTFKTLIQTTTLMCFLCHRVILSRLCLSFSFSLLLVENSYNEEKGRTCRLPIFS